MRQHLPGRDRRDDVADPRRRPPEPGAAASILGLQQAAGNHAVSALLARQPVEAEAEVEPQAEQRGSTMTLGLGDDIVIPLDSAQWDLPHRDVIVMFGSDNPVLARLLNANLGKAQYKTAFLSTVGLMSRMTDAVVAAIQVGDSGGESAYAQVTINFETVKHESVH